MKASPKEHAAQRPRGAAHATFADGVEPSLLEESLAKTVWERMLANDDALRFADLLQTATLKSRAKP